MTTKWGFDDTEATIIGGYFTRYEFWRTDPVLAALGHPVQQLLAREYFESDDDALAWLKENRPEAYTQRKEYPIEMRVFDQPGKREQEIINARQGLQGGLK